MAEQLLPPFTGRAIGYGPAQLDGAARCFRPNTGMPATSRIAVPSPMVISSAWTGRVPVSVSRRPRCSTGVVRAVIRGNFQHQVQDLPQTPPIHPGTVFHGHSTNFFLSVSERVGVDSARCGRRRHVQCAAAHRLYERHEWCTAFNNVNRSLGSRMPVYGARILVYRQVSILRPRSTLKVVLGREETSDVSSSSNH